MSLGYFGTDGIRGRVGQPPLTPPHLLRIALATARHIAPEGGEKGRVVIGMDTRASGPAICEVLAAGFASWGLDVVPLGVVPTPALALATRIHGAQLGVMVTASHNPAGDNGVKFFGPDGYKLDSSDEAAIEAGIAAALSDPLPGLDQAGTVGPDPTIDVRAAYSDAIIDSLPEGTSLKGLSIVIDAAHGAGFDLAPYVLSRLGAMVRTIGSAPNGRNINDQVGSTHPAALSKAVRAAGADAGVALDGDGDRLIMVDEQGRTVDGDQLIGLLATALNSAGQLGNNAVVTTVMSNLGLDRHLSEMGIAMPRTAVGDKYVVEAMRAGGYTLGGEQSGHIVLLDHGTTGDGLLAAVQVLAAAKADGRPFSAVSSVFEPAPQSLRNIRFNGNNPLEDATVKSVIAEVESGLNGDGRVVVRKSGTEPKIRVMVEALDPAAMEAALDRIVSAVESAAT